jgi:hypothetical protein
VITTIGAYNLFAACGRAGLGLCLLKQSIEEPLESRQESNQRMAEHFQGILSAALSACSLIGMARETFIPTLALVEQFFGAVF